MEENYFEVREGEVVANLGEVVFSSYIEIPGFQGILHEFTINGVVFDNKC